MARKEAWWQSPLMAVVGLLGPPALLLGLARLSEDWSVRPGAPPTPPAIVADEPKPLVFPHAFGAERVRPIPVAMDADELLPPRARRETDSRNR